MPPSDAAWQQKLAALRAHVAAHGRLPPRGDAAGLGVWVNTQRHAKKAMDAGRKSKNRMTPQRVATLERVLGWAWEVDIEAAWQERLAALRAFVEAHGRLPPHHDPSGLSDWVYKQRQAKKALDLNKTGKVLRGITPARAAALEDVPGWAWDPHCAIWQEKLAALRAYVGAPGRLPPQSDATGLGHWVNNQRQAKTAMDAGRRTKHGSMTPSRAAALEAVPGWAWDLDLEALWEERLAALRSYVGACGQLPPKRHPSGLGVWVDNQRRAKNAMDAGRTSKEMTPTRAAALEDVPGWAWVVRCRAAFAAPAAPRPPPAKRARTSHRE